MLQNTTGEVSLYEGNDVCCMVFEILDDDFFFTPESEMFKINMLINQNYLNLNNFTINIFITYSLILFLQLIQTTRMDFIL